MGAVFYAEPILTFDLDVFVELPEGTNSLEPLSVVYASLKEDGYVVEAACVLIEGVPVQFLPPYNELIHEALREARNTTYEGVLTHVLRVEHLIAICIQTGREKDRERVRLLRTVPELDRAYLEVLLDRHKLERNWLRLRDKPEIQRLFDAKEARRLALARLSFPEKVRLVIQLQKMAAPLYQARGKRFREWNPT